MRTIESLLAEVNTNPTLRQDLMWVCDLETCDAPENRANSPLAQDCVYNLPSLAFAYDGTGGEYGLLPDGSIGWIGSEGEIGRIAENVDDLLALLLNSPAFQDYTNARLYQSKQPYFIQPFAEYDADYLQAQQRISAALGIAVVEDITEIMLRFYRAATREPVYTYVFTDENRKKWTSDPLID